MKTSTRKILLEWIGSILEGSHITNFTTDWNDGIHLSALIDYCQPGLIPNHASLSKDKALQNIVHAMKLAEKHFGIPQVMRPEDLAVDKPDELSVMTYISYFCCSGSPGEKALLLWVQRQVITANLTITNLTTDWTDGRVLGAVVNAVSGGGFPEYEQMGPEYGLGNCRKSIDAAEQLLGVKKTIEPEEFSSSHLDQLRRMAYLTQFYRAMHAQAHGSCLTDIIIDAAAHKVEVGQLQYPEETGMGRVVSVDLDCSQAGSGVVKAEVMGNACGRLDPRVDTIGPDMYRVIFEPLKPDLYVLSIYYGKNQVNGSPFSINFHLPEADKVQHLGTSLPSDFTGLVALDFDTKDAGKGMLMVQASGESAGSVPIKIETKADGTYTVSFRPQLPDIYKVDIQWWKFSAYAAGSEVGPVPTEVEEEPNNDYKVSFRPPHPDVYKVDVNWGGKPVPGSPFIVNLLPQAQSEKVFCGLPIYTGVGGAIHLPIDVSSAGVGKLTASCRGEESGEVSVKVVGPAKKPYQLSFVPPRNDLYILSAFYDAVEIQGSPYSIDLRNGILELPELEEPDFEESLESGSEISFSVDTDMPTAVTPTTKPKEISRIVGTSSAFIIRLQGREKKRGKITASAVGDRTGSANVLVTKKSEEVFEINFNPSKPDRYTITVMLDEQPIPQSPIIITYLPRKSDASKCRILSLHDIRRLIGVNQSVYITVDTSEAGEGKLEATAEGTWGDEEPPKIEIAPTKELPHVYRITYLPLSLTTHKLNLLWASAPIPHSPLWFTAYNPDTVKTFLHGKVVGVDFHSDARERDLKAHAIHDDTGTQLKVKIGKVKGQYKLTFQPKESGLYRLHVYAKEKEIKGSPFPVRVGALPRPEGIIVIGLEEQVFVKEPLHFTIDAKLAGSGELVIKPIGPHRKDHSELNITDNKDSTYSVEYTPSTAGQHTLNITWAGKAVPLSPFHISAFKPSPEKVECGKAIVVGPNQPVDMLIDTGKAGKGTITAQCSGEECGSIPVNITSTSPTTHKVSFLPEAEDFYKLSVFFDESEVKGSPFEFNLRKVSVIEEQVVTQMPISKVTILDHIPTHLQVNHEVSFRVDTTTAGQGELTVTADVPSTDLEPPELEMNPSKEDPQIYEVSYTPTVAGVHKLHIKWDGENIPASPVRIIVSDIITFPHGKPVVLDINSDCKTGDLESYAIHQESGTQHKVKISRKEKGKLITLEPKEYGLYSIHVLIRQREITGSPLVVRYDKAAQPEKCTVLEMPISGYVKKVVAFKVDTREAGSGVLNVKATGPAGSKEAKVKVKSRKDGTYTVEYTPTAAGDHSFIITWGGVAIPGSPFPISIQEEAKLETVECRIPIEVQPPLVIDAFVEGEEVDGRPEEPREITLTVGTPLRVLVKTKDKKGTLTSAAHGDSCGLTEVQVSQPKRNTFEAFLNPSTPDRYILELKLNGENLPRTPFIVHYILPPTDASKCRILELENIPAQPQPNHEIRFKVDCNGAGPGVLKILSSSPSTSEPGKLEAKPTKKDPHVFDISYTPPVPGLHILDLLWSDETIPGSPLHFPVEQTLLETMQELLESLPGVVETEQPSIIEVGQGVDMGIRTDKGGTITATCIGVEYGSVPVKITSTSATSHKVSFIPAIADLYDLSVFFNNSEVKGSPFCFDLRATKKKPIIEEPVLQMRKEEVENVPQGMNVRLVEKPPRVVDVNKEISLTVDASEAGEGSLKVTAERPSVDQQPATIEVVQSEEEPGLHHFNYIPTSSGNHLLTLKWEGKEIPDSPVSLVAVDLATAHMIHYGNPASVDFETEHEERDLKAFAIYEGSKAGTHQKVKIHRVQKNRYNLSFHPKQPGLYYIHVLDRDKDIPGSPFVVKYGKPPMPDAVKAEILSGTGYVGEVTRLIIDAKEAGSGEVNIHAVGIRGKETGSLAVEDRKDGTYSVEYTPSIPGKEQFLITWAGKEVPGSPFPFTVRDRAAEVLVSEVYLVDRVGDLQLVEFHSVEAGAISEIAATTDRAILVKVKAQTEQQKKGDITASVRGDRVGHAVVQTSRKSASTFEVTFKPPEADRYTAEVKVGDEVVPATPFVVNYTSPPAKGSMCQIVHLETLSTLVQVGREVALRVDARRAGDGSLEALLEGPEEEEDTPEVEVKEKEPYVFRVSFTPREAGTHRLKLKWGEEAVPGAPLNFNVQGIQVFPHGKLVGFEREVDSKISDLEAYAIHEGSGTRLKINVSHLHKGRYKLTLEPKDPGMYAIHMLSRKKELPGSPLYVRYDKPPNPEACKVQWLKQKAWVREVTQFSVDTREAGTGKLNVSVTAPTREEHPNFQISDNKDGTFTATYIPDADGEHFFNIAWDGRALPGSPFCMTVLDPPVVEEPKEVDFSEEAEVEDGAQPEEFNIPIGQALRVRVTPGDRKQRRAKFIATVTGEKTGSSDVAISRTASGFQAYFNPMLPDRYTIELKLRDKQVPRSPFIANYFMPATNASKCRLLGTDSIQNMQLVNETVHLKVDSREAGPGTLQVNADGPSKDEVKISKQQPRIYNVSYTPTAPGIHTLNFTFENQPIPNSPVSLAVGDPKKVSIAESPTGVSLKTGEPITITFDTSKAGCGDFTASCKGKKSGEISATVTKKSPDRYSIVFTPTEVDVYRLSVLWGGHQIRGSPFNLTPVDVDKVKTVGPAMPRGVAGPREMILDTAQAGKGSVTASCINKRGQDVPVSVSETSSNIYKVSFQLPRPDIYTLTVQYGGQDINGSPFHINTLPPNANRVKVTQPEKMELYSLLVYRCNCVDAGSGKLTVSCQGVRYGPVSVNTKEVDTAQYELSFTPDKEDLYRLSIQWEGEDVPGSPFSANFLPPAQPDKVECGEAVSAGTDQPVDMLIDISKAGGGTLTAQCSGEECGSIPVNITSTSPTTHKVSFIPKAEDFYKLSVFFDESEVKGSPFEFDLRKVSAIEEQVVTQMPISKVTILDHIPNHLQVNNEVSFRVDTTTAGQGDLTVTADVPSTDLEPPELEMTPSKEDPQIYEVSYTPTVAGVHKLHIKWDGENIPASPVSIAVSDIITFPHGKPVVLDINSDCKTGDLDSYAIHQESGTQYKVKISRKEKGKFKLTLEPKEYGLYSIHVLIRQREITGSPFVVRYDKAAQPEKCTVLEMPISGYVKKVVAFKVDTREGGSGVLNVKATGPAGSKKAKLKVKSRKDGTYTVEYTPTAAGDHSFIITWGGVAIPGSPFPISIQEEAKLETVECRIPIEVQPPLVIDAFVEGEQVVGRPEEPREITLTVGTPLRVLVKTKDKKGTLTSAAHGDSCGLTEVQVSQPKRNTFEAFLNPSTPDRYILELKLNGENLPRTPFIVHYILPPTDASKCRILELENIPAQPQPNHEIRFKVDCNGAGPGVLKILSSSPPTSKESSKLEAKLAREDHSCIVDISYTPSVPGLHILDLLWSEEIIPGSPLHFSVVIQKEEILLERKIRGSFQATTARSGVSILKEFRRTQTFGRSVQFHLSTIHTGPGTLRLSSTGPGKAEVKVVDNKDGVYSCEFNPTVPGKYHLNILWNEEHIKGSPYLLNFLSKHKLLAITGLQLEHVDFRIGVPYTFQLDCEGVGEGAPTITCRPQNAAKINLTPVEGTQNHYRCEIVPREPGNHEISVQYKHMHIMGSPFNVYFDPSSDASKCQVIQSSVKSEEAGIDKVTLCVSTERAGEGELLASVKDVTTKEPLPITVSRSSENEKHYMLEFSIKQGMEYLVSVTYDQQHIHQSPFKLSLAGPEGAACCHAEGKGLNSMQVGKWSQFIVSTADAGPGELSVKIEKEGEELEPSKLVSSLSDNQYEVKYLPTSCGMYTITVLWAKQHIPGSPFKARCYSPGHAHLLSISEPITTEIYVAKPLQFIVNAEAVTEEGELAVTLRSQTKTIPGQEVIKGEDGNYTCAVCPPEPGKYAVHVHWNGEDIQGSPFNVKVTIPPKPENVRASGPGLSNGYIGQEGNFMIETGGGGPGVLAVDVQGPKGAFKIYMRRHPDNDRTVLVRYNPIDVGPYVIDIMWSGVHIPGSPFKVNIAEQRTPKEDLRVSDIIIVMSVLIARVIYYSQLASLHTGTVCVEKLHCKKYVVVLTT